ncbi:hypothetical protein MT325_m053L [Paramecium bursaria chlorella virus MT325]|uniref:Uncharacterized protein m053L n=1 Tax=Paramecium bursaria Chlorella virus MT325 TaxID=346932 RepID=A7ITD3_PBCVM|nr:hypothetical protein MT325_m053L [Paramecium bursaria chlorella virus MT325]
MASVALELPANAPYPLLYPMLTGREANNSVENKVHTPDHTPLLNKNGVVIVCVTFIGRFVKGASGFVGMLYVVIVIGFT